MSFSKRELMSTVAANLGDPAKLEETDVEAHIDRAVIYYSKVSPNVKVADLAGTGSTYDFAYPSGYQDGFSQILSIEYPLGEQIPVYLSQTEWIQYQDTAGIKIRFIETPAAGETARVTYTAVHTLGTDDDSTTTIIDADEPAIIYLATAFSALELASEGARQAKGSQLDMPFLPGPVSDYLLIYNKYMSRFFEHMDMPADGSKPPAWSQGNLKYLPSWDGGPVIREERSPVPGG